MLTPTPTTASDAEVLGAAASAIATPKVEEGDSFIIHAPLEILARSALLTLAAPEARERIQTLIGEVAESYRGWGTPIQRPARHMETDACSAQLTLARAIEAGDLDSVDDAVAWLAAHLDIDELVVALARPALTSLAAAAHAPILLHLLPRAAPRSLMAPAMARSTFRELARHPSWTLTWIDTIEASGSTRDEPEDQVAVGAELAARLRQPHLVEKPDSTFIHPTMSAVDRSGLATAALADLVPRLSLATARRELLRIAAHSMLQDDPDRAPYGWSHCLTMPQAALSLARATGNPTLGIAVAGTYVLGFRATLGSVAVDPHFVPEPAAIAANELIEAPPARAAAAAWHAPADQHTLIWRALATNAATHPDAHLAKYTLACLDAVRTDPAHEQLYRAAAAYLNAWWESTHRDG